MNIAKSMVRSHNIEAEEDKTRIEMKGVQLEVNQCKYSVEKLFARINAIESTLFQRMAHGKKEFQENR